MVGQYDFRQSDIEQIKNEIAKKLKIKDGKIVFDGKKIIITMKGKPGVTPQKGLDYYDGKSGKPPAHQWEGTKIRFQNPDGTWGQWVDLKGKPGDKGKTPKKGVDYFDGEDGKNPVKGVDYKDGEDGKPGVEPEEMSNIRMELKLTGEWVKSAMKRLAQMDERLANVKDGKTPVKGVDYKDGEEGKTPKKGVDYFDGEDGETPVKGVDYKDGEPGKDAIIPDSVTIAVLTDVELIDGKLSKKYQHVKVYIED